jgi:hypothetical protein
LEYPISALVRRVGFFSIFWSFCKIISIIRPEIKQISNLTRALARTEWVEIVRLISIYFLSHNIMNLSAFSVSVEQTFNLSCAWVWSAELRWRWWDLVTGAKACATELPVRETPWQFLQRSPALGGGTLKENSEGAEQIFVD